MKAENVGLRREDYQKMSYTKLREIEKERILLEIGKLPLADRIIAKRNIEEIMRECSWF